MLSDVQIDFNMKQTHINLLHKTVFERKTSTLRIVQEVKVNPVPDLNKLTLADLEKKNWNESRKSKNK
jgi:hypothetical protein